MVVGCANSIIEVNAPPPASKGSNEELASKPVEMKEAAAFSDALQPLAMFMVGNGPIGGTIIYVYRRFKGVATVRLKNSD